MINLTKFRRSGLWLLSFIAALLTLSPSAAATDYYLRGDGNIGWSSDQVSYKLTTSDNKTYTKEIGTFSGGLKIHASDGTWYSIGESAVTPVSGKGYDPYAGGKYNNIQIPSGSTNVTVIVKDNDSDGTPDEIVVTYLPNWFLIINSDHDNGITFEKNDDGSYSCKKTWDNTSWGFNVKYHKSDGYTCYGREGTLTNNVPYVINGMIAGADMRLNSSAKDKEVTFTLTIGSDNKPANITASWDDGQGGSETIVDYSIYRLGGVDGWGDSGRGFNKSGVINSTVSFSSKPEFKLYNTSTKSYYENLATNYGKGIEEYINAGGFTNFSLKDYDTTAKPEVTFYITFDKDNNPVLNASWAGSEPDTVKVLWAMGAVDASSVTLSNTAEVSSTAGDYQLFDITPEANGTLYFRLEVGDKQRGPQGDSNVAMLNSDDNWVASQEASSRYYFVGSAVAGKTYHVKYNTSDNTVNVTWFAGEAVATDYYLAAGFFDNWTRREKFEPTEENSNVLTLTATYKESNAGNKGFKVTNKQTEDNGTFYSTAGKLDNNTEVSLLTVDEATGKVKPVTEKGNMTLDVTALNRTVVFTLTLGEDGTPASLKAEWTPETPAVESNAVLIIGDLTGAGASLNDWSGGSVTMYKDGEYTYTFQTTKNGKINFGFRNQHPDSKYYQYYPDWSEDCPAHSNIYTNNAKAYSSKKGGAGCWTFDAKGGKKYTITVVPRKSDNETDENCARITISEVLPVYPEGVYNDAAMIRYDQWPVMYLQSQVLNNFRITPEYQMTKKSDTRYELKFTMRNTTTGGDDWKEADFLIWVDSFSGPDAAAKSVTAPMSKSISKGDNFREGARYIAVCEKGNDGKWTLTLNPDPEYDEKLLPYLSMVGYEWKQRKLYVTPCPYSAKNTDKGWQEAWIQYDSRGQVLLDRKGKAMYNTMWPPKNDILFKTEFNVGGSNKDFTINSKDLSFKYVGTKTGAEWKAELGVADKSKQLNYTNSEGKYDYNPQEQAGLALDDNRSYTLYRVSDMWINGKVKLWTGWGGVTGKNGNFDPNWSWHTNWGHFAQQPYTEDPKVIKAEQTIPLSNKDGDMKFYEPTFFKNVYFFYDDKAPVSTYDISYEGSNEKWTLEEYSGSVLYTELAIGGAQIAAISTQDYKRGNFQPSLTALQNVIGGHLKNVTVQSFTTTGGGAVEEMIAEVFNWKASEDSPVANSDFHTLFDACQQDSELSSSSSYEAGVKSIGKWVWDEKEDYPSGDYFYRMTVVLTDNSGTERTVTVDSNPFSIVQDEKLSVNVYQLVKVNQTTNAETGVVTGEYLTFKGSKDNPAVPVLPAYRLFIKNDNKFNKGNVSYDTNTGALISGYVDDKNYEFTYESLKSLPEYNAQTLEFTDKVLIVGSIPSASSIEGYAYGAHDASKSNAPAKAGAATEEYDRSCMRPENDDRFMHVAQVETFNPRQFDLTMKYIASVYDSEGNLSTSDKYVESKGNTYTAVIPEPELTIAKVDVFCGDNPATADVESEIGNFTFRDLDLTYARFHSVCDYIEVKVPNVSDQLQERMILKDFFSIILDNSNDPNQADKQWENVFEFKDNGGVVRGTVMHPTTFNAVRTVKLYKKDGYAYFPRWKNQDLTQIEVSSHKPIDFDHKIISSSLYYQDVDYVENGKTVTYSDLISKFTIRVQQKSDYTPSADPTTKEDAEANEHNYVFHDQKDGLFEHLHHLTANDYYYVAIVDKTKVDEGKTNDKDAIINCYGDVVTDATVNTEAQPDAKEKLHYAVKTTDIMNGNYKDIVITKNLGHYYDGQLEAVQANPFYNQVNVYVSYLYPFAGALPQQANEKPGMQRVVKDYTENVLKSEADVKDFSEDEIITTVETIDSDLLGNVKAGAGFIEVSGNGVEIYGADGVKVATGEGRYEVPAGVYVVRLNGRVEKVIVR